MITLKMHVSGSGTLSLPVVNHVHNRVERFAYSDDIASVSAALDYIESSPITPDNNLRVVNRTGLVPRNAPRLNDEKVNHDTFFGTSYTSWSSEILATNVSVTDEQGLQKPLFWKHRLPDNTTEVSLVEVSRGNRNQVDSGYYVDLTAGYIFTNYKNFFNVKTGAYRIFYVVSVDSLGVSTEAMLSPEPAAKEATWEDIDISTGLLYTTYPIYTRSTGGSLYTFSFNTNSQWFVRSFGRSLIQPLRPMALDAESSWFMRISNGQFYAETNGTVRNYYIPEYHRQPFSPSAPYIFSSYGKMDYVNSSVLKFPRDSIAVGTGLPMSLIIRDYDGTLVKVLSTDNSLEGLRYGSENVFYETDKILDVDNANGFISLGIDILPSWDFVASYYYEADDYEYTGIDLNPVYNSSIQDKVVVIYCKPDQTNIVTDTAIYHLVVDDDGKIVDTNDPDLALWSAGPSPNTNTIVGDSYDDFITNYCTNGSSGIGYMVLVELLVSAEGDLRDTIVYDVRSKGLRPTSDSVLAANPRLVNSAIMDNDQGLLVPKNNVVVIELPYSLLESYGGNLTEAKILDSVKRHLSVEVYPVIKWTGPDSNLSATQTASGEAELTMTWDGPATYKLYRKTNITEDWTEIHSVTQTSEPTNRIIQHTDTGLTAGVYYYEVRLTVDSVEYPAPFHLSIEV